MDVANSVAWYVDQEPSIAVRFADRVETVSLDVAERPFLFRERVGGVRAASLRPFPYHLWYTTDGSTVWVLGVLHDHRDPTVAAHRADQATSPAGDAS
jgi:plasmid stabilization system protein ParE